MSNRVDNDPKEPPEAGSETAVAEPVRPETHKTSDLRAHLMEMDALRGIAIIGVVIQHLTGSWKSAMGPMPIPFLGVDDLTAFVVIPGVPLFFILSGYLLTWTEGERARHGGYSLRSYALRRILRIVPAYYVALVVIILVWPWKTSIADVLWHVSFLHGFHPKYATTMTAVFWSLTPEVIFYCMLPFIVLKLRQLWARLALFVALFSLYLPIIFYAALSRAEKAQEGLVSHFLTLPGVGGLYFFIAGVLLRMLVEHLNARPRSPLQPYIALSLFLVSAPFFLLNPGLYFLHYLELSPAAETALRGIMVSLVVPLMLIAFFAAAVLGAPILRGVLKWRLLVFVGLISYSMFLFHRVVILLVRQKLVGPWQDLIGADDFTRWVSYSAYVLGIFLVVGAISYLSYRYIESPFLRIKPK